MTAKPETASVDTVQDEARKLTLCEGCRDNYYNTRSEPGFDGATRCWSLKTAEVVMRYRIGWWTLQDSPKNYTPVETLSCHHAPGQYAHMARMPQHLHAEALKLGIPIDPQPATEGSR